MLNVWPPEGLRTLERCGRSLIGKNTRNSIYFLILYSFLPNLSTEVDEKLI